MLIVIQCLSIQYHNSIAGVSFLNAFNCLTISYQSWNAQGLDVRTRCDCRLRNQCLNELLDVPWLLPETSQQRRAYCVFYGMHVHGFNHDAVTVQHIITYVISK
jgi:hypothetical protein